jgi:hypothetical protein
VDAQIDGRNVVEVDALLHVLRLVQLRVVVIHHRNLPMLRLLGSDGVVAERGERVVLDGIILEEEDKSLTETENIRL